MTAAVAVATAATIGLFGSLLPARAAAPSASAPPAGPAARAVPHRTHHPDSDSHQAYYPDVDRIVCEINKERTHRSLPSLRISDRASEVGRAHARDMADMGELTSVGSDGRDLRTRLADASLFSAYVSEYMLYGFHHDGYFADMATDPDPRNGLYKAVMQREAVAIGIGYDRRYWDVNLLGKHRRLVTRAPDCSRAVSH